MTFTTIALIAAIATLGLGLGFLFSSTIMLKQWGMLAPDEAKIMSRRNGVIYLGLSTLLFLARTNIPTTIQIKSSLFDNEFIALSLLRQS